MIKKKSSLNEKQITIIEFLLVPQKEQLSEDFKQYRVEWFKPTVKTEVLMFVKAMRKQWWQTRAFYRMKLIAQR